MRILSNARAWWSSRSYSAGFPYQNDRKGWLVIPDEIEQTVSEYASQCIDIRAGNALISAREDSKLLDTTHPHIGT
jgi:hypothetical protein